MVIDQMIKLLIFVSSRYTR